MSIESSSLAPPVWGRGGLILACLAVRLIALDSDPPPWLSWSTGLYTDEGLYTLDARHHVLFGTSAPGNFHDRLLSPVLSFLQQGVFAIFGVGIMQARLLSVVFSLLTLLVFWIGLRRAFGTRTADAGVLFLGLAPPFALYNRTALQETPTVFWLVLAFTLWVYAESITGRRQALLGALAGCSVGAALVFKSLALLAVPALCLKPYRLVGLGLFLSMYALVWYMPHYDQLSRMTTYYRVHQIQPHSVSGLWLNVRRGFGINERGVLLYLLATVPVPCLLAGRAVWRGREGGNAEQFLVVWLLGGLFFCLTSSYAPSRYYVLFLPALMGLAAHRWTALTRPLQLACVGGFLLTSAGWYGATWAERSFAQRDAGRELVRTLPPGSVVIGDFAPVICLNTPFAATTVQPGLANDDHPVESLQATHVMVVRNAKHWQDWWRGHYPESIRPAHRVAAFNFGGWRDYVVDVYAVKDKK